VYNWSTNDDGRKASWIDLKAGHGPRNNKFQHHDPAFAGRVFAIGDLWLPLQRQRFFLLQA